MEEVLKLSIGILILLCGIPIGMFLAKMTKEELKQGQKYFRLIILLSLIGGFIGLIMLNDFLMFSMFFITIVTSQSLKSSK